MVRSLNALLVMTVALLVVALAATYRVQHARVVHAKQLALTAAASAAMVYGACRMAKLARRMESRPVTDAPCCLTNGRDGITRVNESTATCTWYSAMRSRASVRSITSFTWRRCTTSRSTIRSESPSVFRNTALSVPTTRLRSRSAATFDSASAAEAAAVTACNHFLAVSMFPCRVR